MLISANLYFLIPVVKSSGPRSLQRISNGWAGRQWCPFEESFFKCCEFFHKMVRCAGSNKSLAGRVRWEGSETPLYILPSSTTGVLILDTGWVSQGGEGVGQ